MQSTTSTRHVLSLCAVTAGLWLLLSGHYTPLFLFYGLVSVSLTVYLAIRMEVIDHESHPIELRARLLSYWAWLGAEIIKSNLAVAKCVLAGADGIRPSVVAIRTGQRTDVGRTIFANSITLTPGTISLTVREEEIEVHALTEAAVRDLQAGEMTRRVPDPGAEEA